MEATRRRFERIYETHVDRVMAYCLRHLPASAAEDAVAETFLVAWRRLDAVPEEPMGWLIVTARNTIRNRFRAESRSFALTERLAQIATMAADPADVTAERRRDLLAALGALTDDERETVLLTAWDGLPGAEAAHALGISHAALRTRLHRARQKMADALSDEPRSSHV